MKCRGFRFTLFCISCLCICACQNHDAVTFSEGNADHTLDNWIAQDTAQYLCQYSRGAFPNWHLWQEYQQWLKPEEANAIAFVQNRLEKRLPPHRRPKIKAIAKFIEQHTVCTLDTSGIFKETDNSGNIQFTFQQISPQVPNIPPIHAFPNDTPKMLEAKWLEAFNHNYQGNTKTKTIKITLEPKDITKTHYFMRSNIFDSYTAPIQLQDFWKKLESWQLDDALELLSIACAQNNPACNEMNAHYEAALQWHEQASQEFYQNVTLSQPKLTSVSLTGNSRYTAVQITLTNTSNQIYSNILFKTDELVPQFCSLQNKRTQRDDAPVTLGPHQTLQTWCALDEQTSPYIELEFVIATSNP